MIFSVYAVKDNLIGFTMPVIRDNDAIAVRIFDDECNADGSRYKTHPNDFALYYIGTYDTDNGIMQPETVRLVASATEFVKEV